MILSAIFYSTSSLLPSTPNSHADVCIETQISEGPFAITLSIDTHNSLYFFMKGTLGSNITTVKQQ